MNEYRFKIPSLALSGSEALLDASEAELRILLLLIEKGGRATRRELSAGAGISEARVASAVTYWIEAGALCNEDDSVRDTITEEFETRLRAGELDEESSVKVARDIRDNDLAGLLSECATLLGKPTLNEREIKYITELYTQYTLSAEFILTLLADLRSRSKCTVRALVDRAIRLYEKEIDTPESLLEYFRVRDSKSEGERLCRKVLGIWDRAPGQSEKRAFIKWVNEYGYDEPVISRAYDITVTKTGHASVAYMDKLLTDWHEAGCKTLTECERRYEATKPEPKTRSTQKEKAPKERYGTFDPEEAFRRALERSYGKKN